MKTTFLVFLLTVPFAHAESNSKGPDSPVFYGEVTAVSDDDASVHILQEGKYDRVVLLSKETKVVFVGMPKEARQLTVGYWGKASVKGEETKSRQLTLPVGEISSLGPDRASVSEATILAKADENRDGGIDYVEMSRYLFFSPKHGPGKFAKADSDSDGLLDEKELPSLLAEVDWWKYSRQSAGEWFALGDGNGDGSLDYEEFLTISSSVDHAEGLFARADRDSSKTLDEAEVTAYVEGLVARGSADE